MIRVYEEGDLSTNWCGIRVAVSVASKLKQKWLNFNTYSRAAATVEAMNLEDKWLAEQHYAFVNRIFSDTNVHGVHGLACTFDIKRKNNTLYQYKVLKYQTTFEDNLVSQVAYIQPDGSVSDIDWLRICDYIRDSRGIAPETYNILIELKPSISEITNAFKLRE